MTLSGIVPITEEVPFMVIMELECKDCEPVSFLFGKGWKAVNVSNFNFLFNVYYSFIEFFWDILKNVSYNLKWMIVVISKLLLTSLGPQLHSTYPY